MSKKQNDTEKEIVRLTKRLHEALSAKKIPKGEDLKAYFKCYDFYRTHRISHLVPKGAKNLKVRLIEFLINDLKLPARLSVDPVQKEYGNSGLNFNKLVIIALDDRNLIGFHVEESKFTYLKEINRLLLPKLRYKLVLGDFFNSLIAAGKSTVDKVLVDKVFDDPFVKFLANHNKVNEHNNQNRKEDTK